MGKQPSQHLAHAKEDLAIAESGDAKREAYKRAVEHIAAHIDETGDTQKEVAAVLLYSPEKVGKLLKWRKAGYPEGTTPFTMAEPDGSKPTDRAAESHAKQVLADPDQRKRVLGKLTPTERQELATEAVDAGIEDSQPVVAATFRHLEKTETETERKGRQTAHREHIGPAAARACLERAYRNLGDRIHTYGDVPMSESEQATLAGIRKLADHLAGQTEMDDELREILDEATA